jgi:hypothetical protein
MMKKRREEENINVKKQLKSLAYFIEKKMSRMTRTTILFRNQSPI